MNANEARLTTIARSLLGPRYRVTERNGMPTLAVLGEQDESVTGPEWVSVHRLGTNDPERELRRVAALRLAEARTVAVDVEEAGDVYTLVLTEGEKNGRFAAISSDEFGDEVTIGTYRRPNGERHGAEWMVHDGHTDNIGEAVSFASWDGARAAADAWVLRAERPRR